MTMLSRRTLFIATAGLAAMPSLARAAPHVGASPPDFTGTDSDGRPVRLADFRGKLVVLEWTNDGCPYVQKFYGAGAMQQLQRDAAAMGAVWLSVISSAPGEQGAADGALANELTRTRNAAPSHVILDPRGDIGRLYEARVTPHMFVIGRDGLLGYMGGIDSIASARAEDIARATPHTRLAVTAIAAGQPAPSPVTRAYGCSVKYAA